MGLFGTLTFLVRFLDQAKLEGQVMFVGRWGMSHLDNGGPCLNAPPMEGASTVDTEVVN